MAEIAKIDRYDGLNRTPGVALALRANLELVERGLSIPAIMLNWDSKNIVASRFNTPVGIITFAHQDWAKEVRVGVGYVSPEFRGQGIYRQLWTELVKWARELKAKEIIGDTHVDNAPMRAVAKALGRTEGGIVLRYQLEDKDAE